MRVWWDIDFHLNQPLKDIYIYIYHTLIFSLGLFHRCSPCVVVVVGVNSGFSPLYVLMRCLDITYSLQRIVRHRRTTGRPRHLTHLDIYSDRRLSSDCGPTATTTASTSLAPNNHSDNETNVRSASSAQIWRIAFFSGKFDCYPKSTV